MKNQITDSEKEIVKRIRKTEKFYIMFENLLNHVDIKISNVKKQIFGDQQKKTEGNYFDNLSSKNVGYLQKSLYHLLKNV